MPLLLIKIALGVIVVVMDVALVAYAVRWLYEIIKDICNSD